jgi:hydroxyethylthiazole kinase-like uncharacterized protein yjeF
MADYSDTGSDNQALIVDDDALRAWPLPSLDEEGDKEARGLAVIIAGSVQVPGAALLAAQAALRAGAGKVVIATVAEAAMALALAVPEARVVGLPSTAEGGIDPSGAALLDFCLARARTLLIGPGMLDESASCDLARRLCQRYPELPVILDAAAIPAADRPLKDTAAVLITPHAGEMAHLAGVLKEAVLADPRGTARATAARLQTLVALKGANTFIAHHDGRVWQHQASVVGLATAGSGDVLAGLIAGFAARGAPLEQAAAWGVAVHARAGLRLAERLGRVGYLASELAAEAPSVVHGLIPD